MVWRWILRAASSISANIPTPTPARSAAPRAEAFSQREISTALPVISALICCHACNRAPPPTAQRAFRLASGVFFFRLDDHAGLKTEPFEKRFHLIQAGVVRSQTEESATTLRVPKGGAAAAQVGEINYPIGAGRNLGDRMHHFLVAGRGPGVARVGGYRPGG